MSEKKPWAASMPETQFKFMREILSAPSPVGLESAMTHGVINPAIEKFAPKSLSLIHISEPTRPY